MFFFLNFVRFVNATPKNHWFLKTQRFKVSIFSPPFLCFQVFIQINLHKKTVDRTMQFGYNFFFNATINVFFDKNSVQFCPTNATKTLHTFCVQCAMCCVQCAVCSVHSVVCCVQYVICIIQCLLSSVQFVVCSIKFEVCSVQISVCSVNYEVCSVQRSVCSEQ